LQPLEISLEPALFIDFRSLFLEIFKLANLVICVQQHPGLHNPNGLGKESGQYACLDAGISDCIHGLQAPTLINVFSSFVIPKEKGHGGPLAEQGDVEALVESP